MDMGESCTMDGAYGERVPSGLIEDCLNQIRLADDEIRFPRERADAPEIIGSLHSRIRREEILVHYLYDIRICIAEEIEMLLHRLAAVSEITPEMYRE